MLKPPGADKNLNKIVKDTEKTILGLQAQVPAAQLEILNEGNRKLTVQKEITAIRTEVSNKRK